MVGNTARSILFSPPESVNVPISSNGMMVWTAIDNKIYQIIFNAEKSKFDDHLPLVAADDRLVTNTAPIGPIFYGKCLKLVAFAF